MGFCVGLLRSVFQEHDRWTKGLPKIVLRNTYLHLLMEHPQYVGKDQISEQQRTTLVMVGCLQELG